jgi:hypothetical protein
MSTRANIKVNGLDDKGVIVAQADFRVHTDGHDSEGILDCIKAAIAEWKDKVAPVELARAAINQLLAESTSDYTYLFSGLFTDQVSIDYTWLVQIDCTGEATIKAAVKSEDTSDQRNKVHLVISVFQGCVDWAQVFSDKTMAEQAHQKAKADLGIEEGHEAESENVVELFTDVPIVERG